MSTQQKINQKTTIGGLPLLEESHWNSYGHKYWCDRVGSYASSSVAYNLVHFQHYLHKHVGIDNDELILSKKHGWQYPFHEDLLPHWEGFVKEKLTDYQGNLQTFHISKIELPPGTFFAENFMPILCRNSSTLVSLELQKCKLEDEHLSCIASFLSENTSLSILDLSENWISRWSEDTAISLSEAMKNHPELCLVSLKKCSIGSIDSKVTLLSALLEGAANVKTLLLEECDIYTKEAFALVAKYLANNTALTIFDFRDNSSPPYYHHRIENLSSNAKAICQGLEKNNNMYQLSLGCNNIELPTFLKRRDGMSETLTYLDLSDNNISAEGAKIIATYLRRNPPLIELNLSKNKIPGMAGSEVAQALKGNTTLQHLNLNDNRLTGKCVPTFISVLKGGKFLTLGLASNKISRSDRLTLIQGTICDPTSIESVAKSNHKCKLEVGCNTYGDLQSQLLRINALYDDEGKKIHRKVVLALFTMNPSLFNVSNFEDVQLELMPRLLELIQQKVNYGGDLEMHRDKTVCVRRLYELVKGWNLPLLFARGAGVLPKPTPKKRKRSDIRFHFTKKASTSD